MGQGMHIVGQNYAMSSAASQPSIDNNLATELPYRHHRQYRRDPKSRQSDTHLGGGN